MFRPSSNLQVSGMSYVLPCVGALAENSNCGQAAGCLHPAPCSPWQAAASLGECLTWLPAYCLKRRCSTNCAAFQSTCSKLCTAARSQPMHAVAAGAHPHAAVPGNECPAAAGLCSPGAGCTGSGAAAWGGSATAGSGNWHAAARGGADAPAAADVRRYSQTL